MNPNSHRIEIVASDITQLPVDAIVNAANPSRWTKRRGSRCGR